MPKNIVNVIEDIYIHGMNISLGHMFIFISDYQGSMIRGPGSLYFNYLIGKYDLLPGHCANEFTAGEQLSKYIYLKWYFDILLNF